MEQKIRAYLQEVGWQQGLGLENHFVVRFLAQGECNQNFLVADGRQQFVFRLNYESQMNLSNQIMYEFQALGYLQPSLRTPKPYYVDDSRRYFPQGLLVMAFIPGRPLDYRSDLTEAAAIFSDIHNLPISDQLPLKREYRLLTDRVAECRQLLAPVFKSPHMSAKQLQLFEKAWDRCQKNRRQEKIFEEMNCWCINNTEVNAHNFIIGEEQGWLIDWEKPVISHPCQDLTQFLVSTTTLWRGHHQLTYDEKKLFIDQYTAHRSIDQGALEEALAIYSPYMMLRALAWSAMAYDQYLSGTKALKNQAIFEKVSQYLEPVFLERTLKEQVLAYD